MSTSEMTMRPCSVLIGGLALPSNEMPRNLRFGRRTGAVFAALLAACNISYAAQTSSIPTKSDQQTTARPSVPKGPSLGVPATPEEIAAIDISAGPDGAGLPPGSGTPKQGAEVYAAKCIVCHGPEGANGVNDRLAGGQGTLTSGTPVKTIGSYWPYAITIFDYVRRAMPYPAPHSLTDAEAYAVTAYLLRLNGIIRDDDVIDATSLPKIKMPNQGGFTSAAESKR